uniref:Uncharacterized protein n=1 Tax=Rhizophora mucronata TaxID=61149 RepID=A0A2P2N5M3_RHIMU
MEGGCNMVTRDYTYTCHLWRGRVPNIDLKFVSWPCQRASFFIL